MSAEDDAVRAAESGPAPEPGPDPDAAARAALGRARSAAADRGLKPRRRPRTVGAPRGGGGGEPSKPYGSGRDPETVGESLDRLVIEHGWTQPLSIAGVVGRWRDLVGDQIADHCRPETFDEGALVVRTDSSAWAVQVRRLVPQLQRRLADEVGDGVVESITVLPPGGPSWKRGPRSVPGRGPRDTYG